MPRSKTAQKRKQPASTSKTDASSSQTIVSVTKEEPNQKIRKFSGKVPVDEGFPQYANGPYKVYEDDEIIYNAMLNQTNIGENNNKYYIIQIIKHNMKDEFVTLCRWGRVGKVAGRSEVKGSLDKAEKEFSSKFRAKTGNNWYAAHNLVGFIKKKGKYDLVKIDYGSEVAKEKEKIEELFLSKLDEPVQDLMRLIFNTSEWEASVREMKFDVKKAPLGKLTEDQIKAGYASLKKIEDCLKPKINKTKLEEACSEFYTKIPHDFGMKKPPLIETTEAIKEKMELLNALSEIQIGVKLMKQDKDDSKKNQLDSYYESLQCQLTLLDKNDPEYNIVEEYVKTNHGHLHHHIKISVENVFKVYKETNNKRFKKDIGNRMLLWHGSRLTNWCGILKQGLRIAPPEAPVSGYMFGKGVYFADMFSKSAQYCCLSSRQSLGLLLVCDVALGNCNEKKAADYKASVLPKGKHSTKGLGKHEPNKKQHHMMEDGALVPCGEQKDSKISGTWLQYNEYIVYDVAQVNPRYLVKIKTIK